MVVEKGIITVDTKQIDRLTMELKGFEKEVGESTYHALKRTVDFVATQIGRIVRQHYTIKASDIKDTLIKNYPSKKDLSASVESKGHTLSFYHFTHSPKTRPATKKKYKVKVTIKRDSGSQEVNTDPKPFIATLDGGIDHIVKREGTERKPIVVLRTLSVPQMITNENVGEEIQKAAMEKFNERLEHEIIRNMTSIQKNIRK